MLDRIKQEKLVYDKFEPWLVPVMAGSVLALILALAGVVLMTIGAGRNNEDKKVHLNFFDQMLHGNRSSSGIYDMADGYFCNCSGNG